jgi:restriction endonuclease S subunit
MRLGAEYFIETFLAEEAKLNEIKSSKLSELASLSDKKINPAEEADKQFNYIEIDNVDTVSGIIKPQSILGHMAPSRARKQVHKKNIIVSMVRPNRNAVALVPPELDGAVCSTGFAVVIPRDISPEYLFAYLKTKYAINQLVRRTTASMYPAVTEYDVRNLIVAIPPKEVEESIVKMVVDAKTCFEEARNCYNQALCLLYEAVNFSVDLRSGKTFSTTFAKTFSNRLDAEYYQPKYEVLEEKLENCPNMRSLEEISKFITSGSYISSYEDKGTLYLRVQNIQELELNLEDVKYVTPERHKVSPRIFVQKNDLLLTRTGTNGVALVAPPESYGAILSQHITRIALKTGYDPFYVMICLNSRIGRLQTERSVVGSLQKEFVHESMKKLKVPFVEPQKEIGELARKAVSCVSKGKATLKEIQAAIVKMVEQSASA